MSKYKLPEWMAGKAIRALAGGLLVCGAGYTAVQGYQGKINFQPDTYATEKEFQENRVVFPGEEDYNVSGGEDGDSQMWEHDNEAEEKLKKENIPDSPFLFETNKKVMEALKNEENVPEWNVNLPAKEGTEPQSGGQGAENEFVVIAENQPAEKSPVLSVPGGNKGNGDHLGSDGKGDGTGNGTGDGTGESSENEDNDSSGLGNGGSSGSSGGGGGSSEGPDTPTAPEEPVNPDIPVNPEEPVTPVNPEAPVPPTPDVPVVPEDPDPAPDFPEDFTGDVWGPIPSFPSEGIESSGDGESSSVVDLEIITEEADFGRNLESIYYGEVLDEEGWKLLCSAYFYVSIDGKPFQYRLTEYSDNFMVGAFPNVVDQDFSVEFSFRPNSQSPWIHKTVEFKVKPYKLVIAGYDSEENIGIEYPEEGRVR